MRFILLAFFFFLPVVAYAALVNINTADAVQLDTLPGIGPSKAAAIIDYRTQYGPFTTIESIQNVSGIGPVTFANLSEFITVDSTPAGGGPASGGKPPAPQTSSHKVQAVTPASPIISPEPNVQTHEEEVRAPVAVTELAAAGAALPPPATSSRVSALFGSIWALGLLAVILVAGGAFVFL